MMGTKIEDLKDGQWHDVTAKVIQIWNNEHGAIRQVGIIGDETGIVKFVSWEKSNLPLVVVEVEYDFRNIVVSEFDGKLQIAFNSNTVIERVGGVQSELPDESPAPTPTPAPAAREDIPTV